MEITNEDDFHVVAFVTILNVLLALIGYGIIFKSLANNSSLRRSSPWLLSLGVADLLFTMQVAMVAVACLYGRWPFGHTGQYLHAYLAICMGLNAIASNAGVLLDILEKEKQIVLVNWDKRRFIVFTWLAAMLITYVYYTVTKPFTVAETTFGCLVNLDDDGIFSRSIIVLLGFGWFMVPVYYMARCCILLEEKGKLVCLIPISFLVAYTPFAICSLLSVTVGLDRIYYNNIWIHGHKSRRKRIDDVCSLVFLCFVNIM